jgi:hypothetical protein
LHFYATNSPRHAVPLPVNILAIARGARPYNGLQSNAQPE